jgi:hypothetical protein
MFEMRGKPTTASSIAKHTCLYVIIQEIQLLTKIMVYIFTMASILIAHRIGEINSDAID